MPDPAGWPVTATEVLVAGSGAAGLTAALAAAAGGARVTLAERADLLGGTTALSFGRVWVPASQYAPADDAAAARRYLGGLFDPAYPAMTEAFLEAAPRMARFAERHSPLRFTPCRGYPDYHPSRPGASAGGRALDVTPVELGRLTPAAREVRIPAGYVPLTHEEWERWRYPRRYDWDLLKSREAQGVLAGGAGLAAALLEGVLRAGVRVVARTRLTEVETGHDGAVVVAHLEGHGRLATRAVILATGGFDRDDGLRGRLLPSPVTATGAAPGNTGDALRIAAGLGAELGNTAQGWWMPMATVPGERLEGEPQYRSVIRERALPRQIIVNEAGQRFADEALPYNEFVKAMLRRDADGQYPDATAWMVFDEGYRRRYPVPACGHDEPVPAWVTTAGSLPELAALIGVPAGALAATVARWNRHCAAGADADYGRGRDSYERYMGDPEAAPHPNLGRLDQPPYYAIRLLPGTIGTKGGPVTDTWARVLAADGTPIGGLYAAGNAAAFWTADGYPGPGATLGIAMTMGYLAGRHAAAQSAPADLTAP